MNATVSLYDENGLVEKVNIDDIDNKQCFSYTDNESNNCEFCIYDNGLCFFKEYEDHVLELHLRGKNYAKIITSEGIVKIDVKVVDFLLNDDIVVMRYIIDDVERKIELNYRS